MKNKNRKYNYYSKCYNNINDTLLICMIREKQEARRLKEKEKEERQLTEQALATEKVINFIIYKFYLLYL